MGVRLIVGQSNGLRSSDGSVRLYSIASKELNWSLIAITTTPTNAKPSDAASTPSLTYHAVLSLYSAHLDSTPFH